MARKFKTVDYERSGQQTLTIDDCLPADHLARFIVAIIEMLDLSAFYAYYAAVGGVPIDPKVLLGLLLYGYATGVFSSRKIEQAIYEIIPFRFIAGGLHPDHSTIAWFRKQFLTEIKGVFAQVLLVAHEMGYLELGNISLDGSKVHADASKSKAVSYGRLLKLEEQLRQEVEELLALGEQADETELPEGLEIDTEVAFRQERLVNLAEAKRVLEARAGERYQAELAEYQAKLRAREEKAQETGRKPRGPEPKPPKPGARDKDQYNFTDPDSRIMKNSSNSGFDQHYNVQVAVDQDSMFIAGKHVVESIPSTRMRRFPPSMPSRPRSASPKRLRWTIATLPPGIFESLRPGRLIYSSPRDVSHTTRAGASVLPRRLNHRRMMRD